MTSNTQDNTGAFETAPGLRESGKNTASEDTSPQYGGQGTNTTQCDSSRFGEQQKQQERGEGGIGNTDDSSRFGEGQQKPHCQGRGQGGIGTGVGHHKHQEGRPCDTGAGGMKKDTSQWPSEQSAVTSEYDGTGTKARDTGRYAGDTTAGTTATGNQYPTTGHRGEGATTGYGNGEQVGEITDRYGGDPTAGSGTGTDTTTGRHGGGHHKQHQGDTHASNQDSEVTGTGVTGKPSTTEKIIGTFEKNAGKLMHREDLKNKGEERIAGGQAAKGN
jgi:hypothetical protein